MAAAVVEGTMTTVDVVVTPPLTTVTIELVGVDTTTVVADETITVDDSETPTLTVLDTGVVLTIAK